MVKQLTAGSPAGVTRSKRSSGAFDNIPEWVLMITSWRDGYICKWDLSATLEESGLDS